MHTAVGRWNFHCPSWIATMHCLRHASEDFRIFWVSGKTRRCVCETTRKSKCREVTSKWIFHNWCCFQMNLRPAQFLVLPIICIVNILVQTQRPLQPVQREWEEKFAIVSYCKITEFVCNFQLTETFINWMELFNDSSSSAKRKNSIKFVPWKQL